MSLVVLKVGGELLEDGAALRAVADGVARVTAGGTPLVIVHGGGREIDAALEAAGIEKRQIDGLRITDAATLEIVVSVLAGAVNTRFVAALTTAGVPAVGLTGADGSCGLCDTAGPHRALDGRLVDLGRVGVPSDRAEMRLLAALVSQGFVPVVACIGVGDDGRLLNVNADTLAGHLAARLGARRLVIAGTTSGVLDGSGATLALVEAQMIPRLLDNGTATAGMIAKLRASERALSAGVGEVVIVDGRDSSALESATGHDAPPRSTLLVSTVTQGA